MLNLNCWIFNEDYTSVFPIEIGCTKTIGNLKNAIKEDQRIAFQHVDPRNLDLWMVSIFIDTSLKQNFDKLGLQNELPLLPGTKLSKIFSDEPKDEHVHIVVRPPPTCMCEWLICYTTK
jgi:Crinkler effector protein N-terminal domain